MIETAFWYACDRPEVSRDQVHGLLKFIDDLFALLACIIEQL
jgi:hypothetical protein